MKRRTNIPVWSVLLLMLVSCATDYQLTTCIYKDGRVEKEAYVFADSAFLAGNRQSNPFLFKLSDGWKLQTPDSCITLDLWGEKKKFNAKAVRELDASDGLSFFVPEKEWMRPLAAPGEKLEKRFRWFYTYYTYTCTFHQVTETGPVPIGEYLSGQEQMFLFRGDMSACREMNGLELDAKLNEVTQKFQEWFGRTQFVLSYEVVESFLEEAEDTTFLVRMKADREAVFKANKKRSMNEECSPKDVCALLDKHYGTTAFGDLYKAEEKRMDKCFEQKCITAELFGYRIKAVFRMPGTLLAANTPVIEKGMPVWKVDAYRLLPGEYTLSAESRTMNVWAFGVTGGLVVLAIYVFFILNAVKRKKKLV